ncbi:hypothetical protein BHM03_00051201 [Ensete ventricosum]|nr:hypothetical protein BHM03_00051201 [Ensete ventricosum]
MVNTHARWGGHVTSGSLALLSCPLSRRADVVVLRCASSNAIHVLPKRSHSATSGSLGRNEVVSQLQFHSVHPNQEIPPEEVTRKVPKASNKRSVEAPSGQWKKAKVLGRYKSRREGVEIPGSFGQEANCPGRGDTDSQGEAEQDGEALIKYVREMQSEVLMDQATKTMVLREGGEYEGEAKLQPINHESLLLFIESHQEP